MRAFSPRIRLGLLLLPLAGCATPAATRAAPSLKELYAAKFQIGAAIAPSMTRDPALAALIARHFSSITAENAMKAYAIARGEGVYDFADADALVAFAAANGQIIRGHTLLWHWRSATQNAAPDWFFEGDRAAVQRRLETYITAVVTHFRGRVYAWDVVNEAASNSDGETYRRSRWFEALGPDYVEIAFRAARAADPDALLFLNDYDTEQPGKLARLMTIIDALKAKNVPIDGVGHQLHMRFSDDIAGVRAALAATEARGLVNHVTELDITLYEDPASCYGAARQACEAAFPGPPPADRVAAQARLYGALFREFAARPSVKSVTFWGVTDALSWLHGFPVARPNYPLLFDADGAPKPAFWAVASPS
ncbi:MAG: endo-1,4-beta-xylanase [Hyphomonadaceae bacterium]|nr:endo-1,4-beta-xylanase [Hyphomonadaceae bacterium]